MPTVADFALVAKHKVRFGVSVDLNVTVGNFHHDVHALACNLGARGLTCSVERCSRHTRSVVVVRFAVQRYGRVQNFALLRYAEVGYAVFRAVGKLRNFVRRYGNVYGVVGVFGHRHAVGDVPRSVNGRLFVVKSVCAEVGRCGNLCGVHAVISQCVAKVNCRCVEYRRLTAVKVHNAFVTNHFVGVGRLDVATRRTRPGTFGTACAFRFDVVEGGHVSYIAAVADAEG